MKPTFAGSPAYRKQTLLKLITLINWTCSVCYTKSHYIPNLVLQYSCTCTCAAHLTDRKIVSGIVKFPFAGEVKLKMSSIWRVKSYCTLSALLLYEESYCRIMVFCSGPYCRQKNVQCQHLNAGYIVYHINTRRGQVK